MQGIYEGITTRLSMLLFYPDPYRLTNGMQHCLSPCPWLFCYSMCLVCLHKIWLLPHLTRLSVLLSFCPSEDVTVNITPSLSYFTPLCYHLYICLSFFFLLIFFLPTLSLSLHLSCRLFIRCVNNCLPTAVIAPPCQTEVWSKWQCAQFSLAYIVQFLVSLVPLAKKRKNSSPAAVVFYLWD